MSMWSCDIVFQRLSSTPSSEVDVMTALFTSHIYTQISPLFHLRLHGKWWVESDGQCYPVLVLTVWTAVSPSSEFILLVMGPSLQCF
jgi:hypothetical protein